MKVVGQLVSKYVKPEINLVKNKLLTSSTPALAEVLINRGKNVNNAYAIADRFIAMNKNKIANAPKTNIQKAINYCAEKSKPVSTVFNKIDSFLTKWFG